MTLKQLQNNFQNTVFTTTQVQRVFADELWSSVNIQLQRLVARGEVKRLKRSTFMLSGSTIDELSVANQLYPQSYVSLETALNYYGITPDIVAQVTSVTPITSKLIHTQQGVFSYSKIDRKLYFGFKLLSTSLPNQFIRIAQPEKALLDYIYIRRLSKLNFNEQRIDFSVLDVPRLKQMSADYPNWVKEQVIYESNHQ